MGMNGPGGDMKGNSDRKLPNIQQTRFLAFILQMHSVKRNKFNIESNKFQDRFPRNSQ